MLFWGAVVLVAFLATLILGLRGIVVYTVIAVALTVLFFKATLGFSVLFLAAALPIGGAPMVPGYIAHCLIVERRVTSDDEDGQ